MINEANPYAPTESTEDQPPTASDTNDLPEPRRTFRWQILPCLFNGLFALVCVALIVVQVQFLVDLFSRWDRSSAPVAELITDLIVVAAAMIMIGSQIMAFLNWSARRHFRGLVWTLVGLAIFACVDPHPEWIYAFVRDFTETIGWDPPGM